MVSPPSLRIYVRLHRDSSHMSHFTLPVAVDFSFRSKDLSVTPSRRREAAVLDTRNANSSV